MENIVTADLSEFGYRELDEASNLLKSYATNGTPDGFDSEGLTLWFNKNSGNVFLSNDEYQTLMLTDKNNLEQWYNCPVCGFEGFKDEFIDVENHNEGGDKKYLKECKEYIAEI